MTDLSRYRRQIVLREIGVNGQQLLKDSSALVVGVGGLGSAAAPYLAGAGVGRLLLTDLDRIDLSNLQRQLLYRHVDLGRAKLQVAGESLRALNPDCEIEMLEGPLGNQALLDAVRRADVVLDCSDNFPTRYAVNAACVAARTPLVSGAAIRFEGQLAVFDLRRGGPCYACLFPVSEGESAESCEEAGILGPVSGTIGSLQALAAIKLLLGIGNDAGTLHLWNALASKWRITQLRREPRCPVCAETATLHR